MLDLEQLLRVPYVDPYAGFDISPDGSRVAFSWNRTGQWEIYELRLDCPDGIEQVTSGPGAKSGPRYSPDGRLLAYMLDMDGGEAFDICVYDFARRMHTNLTPDTSYAFQPGVSWSPSGEQLACISEQSGRFSTYLLNLASGECRALFDGGGPHHDLCWSPEGSHVAVAAEGRGQDFTTYIIAVERGDVCAVKSNDALLNAKDPCWSPDGRFLAFCSDHPGIYQIGIYDLARGQVAWLTTGAGEKTSPRWSPDSKRLAYLIAEGPDSWLGIADGSGAPCWGASNSYRCQVEPGVHYSPQFTPDSQRILFVFDNPRLPGDLWQWDFHNQAFCQITHSLPPELAGQDFVMPQHVYYPSLDGTLVPAILYLPSVSHSLSADHHSPPPGVIVVHGGPDWLFQFLWYPLMTHLASRGWVVLAPNYRGSTGYGRDWQLANRFELGHLDAMDVASGADYLAQHGLADPRRIALTGRSHGGYLTMCCLTQYPERWAGGSAVVPFLNWFTSHANSRIDLQHWDIENMGDARQNADRWRQRSPFFFLDCIQAPVQLICGAHDPRCPASESLAARDALQSLGKPVDLLLYPDEGHTFLKIENIVDHELRRVAFIHDVLSGPPAIGDAGGRVPSHQPFDP